MVRSPVHSASYSPVVAEDGDGMVVDETDAETDPLHSTDSDTNGRASDEDEDEVGEGGSDKR